MHGIFQYKGKMFFSRLNSLFWPLLRNTSPSEFPMPILTAALFFGLSLSPRRKGICSGKKDLVDDVYQDMSDSVPGTSGSTSPSGDVDLQLSEGWLAEIFNDAEREVSSDYVNVSGPGDDLIDVAELLDAQPANEQHVLVDVAELHDTQPAHEQHVVQQHVSRSHPINVFKGRKSMDLMPRKLATSVTYPFAFIKPSGAEGDVTLKEINQRIQTLPSSKPKAKIEDPSSYPTSTFSGKPVVSKVKVRTKGGKGSIIVIRTIG